MTERIEIRTEAPASPIFDKMRFSLTAASCVLGVSDIISGKDDSKRSCSSRSRYSFSRISSEAENKMRSVHG